MQSEMPALAGPAGEIPLSAQSPEMLALAERAADGDAEAMQQLEALGAEGYLVNIARASVVDTQALVVALAGGTATGLEGHSSQAAAHSSRTTSNSRRRHRRRS